MARVPSDVTSIGNPASAAESSDARVVSLMGVRHRSEESLLTRECQMCERNVCTVEAP